MKILIVIIVIVVVAVGGFMLIKSQKSSAPDGSLPAGSADFILAVIEKGVFAKNLQDSDFVEVDNQTAVREGSEIKTNETGRAKLLYPNGTISAVEESTQIKLTVLSSQGGKSKIKIISGGVWSKIKNALGVGEFYQVETENIVASVRGTIWGTSFKDNTSSVYSLENKITVAALNPITGQEIAGTETEVKSGNKIVLKTTEKIISGEKLPVAPLTPDDLRKPIIERNLQLFLDQDDLKNPDIEELMKLTNESPSSSPAPKNSPTATPKSTPSASPKAIQNTVTPTPTATPAPTQQIQSIYPRIIVAGEQFTINGNNFITGRNVKQVTNILIGANPAQFYIIDAQTIFATAPSDIQPGVYDVSIITLSGQTLSLNNALTIR